MRGQPDPELRPRHAKRTQNRRRQQRNVFIYGAGKAGKELAISMIGHPEMRLTGFFDDDHRLHGRKVDGVVVHSPQSLSEIVRTKAVDDVVLALPNISRSRARTSLASLSSSSYTSGPSLTCRAC
ncbi:MAG: hypothetical protein HC794_02200 [Nitrospiraceae bacterium]|nr:hypothetical protein [Nitrospiraceae bacterium]